MTGIFFSPTDIVKGIRFARRTVQATQTDEDGSIAQFDDIEEQLQRFKAAINKSRTVSTTAEMDAALQSYETAIKALDRKLGPYRAAFSDPEVRKRRGKEVEKKARFARVIGGIMKEFDERIARELRILDVNGRIIASHGAVESFKPRIQEDPVSKRIANLELQMEILKRHYSSQVGSTQPEQSDAESWSGSEVTVCNNETAVMRRNSEDFLRNVQNNRQERFKGMAPRHYTQINSHTNSIGYCTSMTEHHAQYDSESDENADAGSRIGTALGHIVKGVISLMDVCIERPRFSLWYSTGVDWKELESQGLRIDPAKPYNNTLFFMTWPALDYIRSLQYGSENLFVQFIPADASAIQIRADLKEASSGLAHAYGHCRDGNGTWFVDKEYATIENYPTSNTDTPIETTRGRLTDPHKVGHIRIFFNLSKSLRISLRIKGSDFLVRYSNCIREIERLKLRYQHSHDLPGRWPASNAKTDVVLPLLPPATLCPQPRTCDWLVDISENISQTFSDDASRVKEKLHLLTSIDPDNGDWISDRNLCQWIRISEPTRHRIERKLPDGSVSVTFREYHLSVRTHSPSDSIDVIPTTCLSMRGCLCATECTTKKQLNMCTFWMKDVPGFSRRYDVDGKPTTDLWKTLFTLICDIRILDKYGRYTDTLPAKVVATRHSWDEDVKILVDDFEPWELKSLLGISDCSEVTEAAS